MKREFANTNYDANSVVLTLTPEEAGALTIALLLASWSAITLEDKTKHEIFNRMYQELTSPFIKP